MIIDIEFLEYEVDNFFVVFIVIVWLLEINVFFLGICRLVVVWISRFVFVDIKLEVIFNCGFFILYVKFGLVVGEIECSVMLIVVDINWGVRGLIEFDEVVCVGSMVVEDE